MSCVIQVFVSSDISLYHPGNHDITLNTTNISVCNGYYSQDSECMHVFSSEITNKKPSYL